ncbi:7889_t:CDS:2 [Ambispora leptoticha]|uniref:7889_t:CDS:1 n=1 Tax=Ambispora leptoticha TaxID=144679 RepID=A0A9N9APS4_9GLOM|nr:7889_t:CDS:2 [Ambispora leptoticha]
MNLNSQTKTKTQRATYTSRFKSASKENLPKTPGSGGLLSGGGNTKTAIPVSTNTSNAKKRQVINSGLKTPIISSTVSSRIGSTLRNPLSRISSVSTPKNTSAIPLSKPTVLSSAFSKSKSQNLSVSGNVKSKRVTFAVNVEPKKPAAGTKSSLMPAKKSTISSSFIRPKSTAINLFSNLQPPPGSIRKPTLKNISNTPNLKRPIRNTAATTTKTSKKAVINTPITKRPSTISSSTTVSRKSSISIEPKIRGLSSVRRSPANKSQIKFKPDASALKEIVASETSSDVDKKRQLLTSSLLGNRSRSSIGVRGSLRLSQATSSYGHRVEEHRESQRVSILGAAIRVMRPIQEESQKKTLSNIRESLLVKPVTSTRTLTERQIKFKPDASALKEIIASETSSDVDKKRQLLTSSSLLNSRSRSSIGVRGSLRLSQAASSYGHRVEKHRESQRASILGAAIRVMRPIQEESQKKALSNIRESLSLVKPVTSTRTLTGRQSLLFTRTIKGTV